MTSTEFTMFRFHGVQRVGLFAAALALGAVVSLSDYGAQAVIAVIFLIVLIYAALKYPLQLVYFLLLTGSLSWGFVTSDQKVFFSGLGGVDLNGIRLVGVVVAFGILITYRPDARKVFFTLKPYLVFLFFASIGLLYTWNFNSGLRLFTKFLYPYLIFVVILIEAKDRATIDKLIRVMFWGGIIALISIPLSIMGGLSTQFEPDSIKLGGGATHRSPFAFYMMCITTFSVALFIYLKQKKFLSLAALGSVVVLLSLTRIAIAGLVVALTFVFLRKSLWKGVIVVAVMIPLVLSYEPLRERMFYSTESNWVDLIREPQRVFTDIHEMGRFAAWGAGIRGMFLQAPVMGMGIGSSTGIEYESGNYLTVMHSEVVRMLAEQGLLGAVLYLIALYSLVRKVKSTAKESPTGVTAACLLALPAVVLGYLVTCLTDNSYDYYTQLGQTFFAIAAIGICSARLDASERDADKFQ